MSYNFSFDKKTIAFLLGGSAFVGIMLFMAGLLVGANWRTEQPAVAAVTTTGGQPPAAQPAPAPQPAEPVLRAPAARQESNPPADTTAAPDSASSLAKQAHSSAIPQSSGEPSPAKLPISDGEIKIIERANPARTKADDFSKLNQASFSVQVGVFVSEEEANQLVRQLQGKGYMPFVLSTTDDESRMWFAVRVGTYTDVADAARAAFNIATQEKIKTFVRPTGSL